MSVDAGTYCANDRINHERYGLGTVRMVDESHVIIDFDLNGRRKFVTSIVQLVRSDVAAPEKKRRAAPKTKKKK